MFRLLSAALLVVVGLGGHIVIAQVRDPATPGVARESVAATKYLQVVGDHLFVVAWGRGLQVLDISDPACPKWSGGWNPRRCPMGLHVVGRHAYIADRLAGLTVLDVSNPAQPAQLGNVDTPGDATAVHVAGHRAYVADGPGGLQIVNVTEPARPVLLGRCAIPQRATGVQVVGHYAWVTEPNGVHVVDVRDPHHPVIVATHHATFYGFDGRVQSFRTNTLLVAHLPMLQVLNISDPTRPQLIDRVITETNDLPIVVRRDPNGFFMQHGYAWMLTNNGFAETLRNRFPTNVPRDIAELIANFRASPYYPEYISRRSGVPSGLHALHTLGNLAVGVDSKTFVTMDLSELTSPRRLGRYEFGGSALDVRAAGRHAYVMDNGANILVMDLSDPERPVAVGRFDSRGYASAALALSDAGRPEAANQAETPPDVPAVVNMPELLAPERQPDGGFAFTLRAESGAVCVIQVSADFIHWTPLGNYTLPASGELRLTDPDAATEPQRFYRAVRQP